MTPDGRQGVPTAADLVAALGGFLAEEAVPGTEGHLRYMARVAEKVAGSVRRELELEPAFDRAQAARLAALGVASEAELAAAIRAGRFDERLPEAVETMSAGAVERLRMWNPGYLDPGDAAAAGE